MPIWRTTVPTPSSGMSATRNEPPSHVPRRTLSNGGLQNGNCYAGTGFKVNGAARAWLSSHRECAWPVSRPDGALCHVLPDRWSRLSCQSADTRLSRAGRSAGEPLVDARRRAISGPEPLYQHIAAQLCTANYPIATDGERHRHLRRSIKTAFSHQALAGTVQPMLQSAMTLACQLHPGQRVRVLSLFHRMIGEQLGVALLHQPLGKRWRQAVTFARFSVGHGLGAYPIFAKHMPRYQSAKRTILQFMHEIVAAHREHPPGKERAEDVVDMLLEMMDHTGQPFSDQDIVANAQMIYSNSLLYAAPAASFLLYALLKYPTVLARFKTEVDALFADGVPTYQQLTTAPTLRGALLESMRRFPIALAMPRVVTTPFEFEGYTIPSGERVLLAVTVTHFLPACFSDPYTFDLDRFCPPRSEQIPAGMYQRYGMGQHSCIGANVADLAVLTSVATLIHRLDLALVHFDYLLRRVVNPFPEPEGSFAIRVIGTR
jgi:cytochrome P450